MLSGHVRQTQVRSTAPLIGLQERTGYQAMTSAYQIRSWGHTDIGLRRANNEDTYQIDDQHGYYVVADGMGGEAAGDVASRIFIETVDELRVGDARRGAEEAVKLLQDVFTNANARILDYVQHHPDCEGMGCTAELLLLHAEGFILGHVGDSRTYRLRSESLQQLTKDHSLVQQQLDEGLISFEESQKHPLQNVILRAVGIEEDIAVDIVRGSLIYGDKLCLCSDGLSDLVPESMIAQILGSDTPPKKKIERLIEEANSLGGTDNITAVLIEIIS